eukprot:TRINITY_DN2593_c0_g1_i1.p1 TRINITY_DN2593_c0_g1~~TRINITY_DN2593_c0_g1_i1.p1  ORF type:complete len:576 (+),score=133.36 TRINITY_DN2593_c0_g1_i1:70-1728(+)
MVQSMAYSRLMAMNSRSVSPMRKGRLPPKPEQRRHQPWCTGMCGGRCIPQVAPQHADWCNGACGGVCMSTTPVHLPQQPPLPPQDEDKTLSLADEEEDWENMMKDAVLRVRARLPAEPRSPPEVIDPTGPVFDLDMSLNLPNPNALSFTSSNVLKEHHDLRSSEPQGSPPPPPASVATHPESLHTISEGLDATRETRDECDQKSNNILIEEEAEENEEGVHDHDHDHDTQQQEEEEVRDMVTEPTTGSELRRSTAAFRKTLELLQSEVQQVLKSEHDIEQEEVCNEPPVSTAKGPVSTAKGPVYDITTLQIQSHPTELADIKNLFSESLKDTSSEASSVPTERANDIRRLCDSPREIEERHSSPAVTNKQPWKIVQWKEEQTKKWGCKKHDKEFTAWCYEEGCNAIICPDCISMDHVGHNTLAIPDKKEMTRKLEEIRSGVGSTGKELLDAPAKLKQDCQTRNPNRAAHSTLVTCIDSLENETSTAFASVDEQLNYLTGKMSATKSSWPTVRRRVRQEPSSSLEPPPMYGQGMTPIAREHKHLLSRSSFTTY